MSFERAVPANAAQLKENLQQIQKNRSHVKGVNVNLTTAHLEIVLDGAAHFVGKPDFYIPLKRAKINDAKLLVEKMIRDIDTGFTPSDADIHALYDMIDPSQK
jgi:hypothetical protein